MKRPIICLLGLAGLIFLLADPSYSNGIDELNAAIQEKGARWFARDTPLSNLSSEELRTWTGAQEDTAFPGMAPDPSFYAPMSLPPSFDWTNHNGNYVTPVKNQHSPPRERNVGSKTTYGRSTKGAALDAGYYGFFVGKR